MIAFDVTNLFIPYQFQKTIPLVASLLITNNVAEHVKINILTLLKFSLSQKIFQFHNSYYSRPDWPNMECMLSHFLADVIMNNFENNHIINKINKIKHYFRYVDNCLVFIDGNANDAKDILDYINNLHNHIKFTLEVELNSKINFLDLTISRKHNLLEV